MTGDTWCQEGCKLRSSGGKTCVFVQVIQNLNLNFWRAGNNELDRFQFFLFCWHGSNEAWANLSISSAAHLLIISEHLKSKLNIYQVR